MKSKRQGGQFPDEPMTFPGGQLVTGPQGLLLKSARWKEIFLDEKGFVKRQASGKQRAVQAGPWMGPGDLDPTPRLLLRTWTRLSYQSPHLKTERTAFRFPSNIFNGFLSLSLFFFFFWLIAHWFSVFKFLQTMWTYRSLQFCLPGFISLHIQHASILSTTYSVMWRRSSHLGALLLFSQMDSGLSQRLQDLAVPADLSTEAERKSDRLLGNQLGGRLVKV